MRFYFAKGVEKMKFDNRLVAGIFIGLLLGLHYHATLMGFLPILVLCTLIFAARIIHH